MTMVALQKHRTKESYETLSYHHFTLLIMRTEKQLSIVITWQNIGQLNTYTEEKSDLAIQKGTPGKENKTNFKF